MDIWRSHKEEEDFRRAEEARTWKDWAYRAFQKQMAAKGKTSGE